MSVVLQPRLRKTALEALDASVDALGVSADFDRFLAFEQRTAFIYTRLKGRIALGYTPNLRAPRSFNEKSIHRRLFSRDPIWPVVTDKVRVRSWLAERGLDRGISFVPILHVIDDPDRFDFSQIAAPVVIKAAWGSGLNLFIRDPARENWSAVRAKMKHWLAASYYPKRLVWPETQMTRVFTVESMHGNTPQGLLDDYKFFVFHGRVELVQVISGRAGQIEYSHYNRDLTPLPGVTRRGKKAGKGEDLPSQVAAMTPLVERIGAQFDFARIDMYLLDGRIMLGEITQAPVNGYAAFTPKRFDFELGEKWNYDHARIYDAFRWGYPLRTVSAG